MKMPGTIVSARVRRIKDVLDLYGGRNMPNLPPPTAAKTPTSRTPTSRIFCGRFSDAISCSRKPYSVTSHGAFGPGDGENTKGKSARFLTRLQTNQSLSESHTGGSVLMACCGEASALRYLCTLYFRLGGRQLKR